MLTVLHECTVQYGTGSSYCSESAFSPVAVFERSRSVAIAVTLLKDPGCILFIILFLDLIKELVQNANKNVDKTFNTLNKKLSELHKD